jgi:hypothetical protein
MRKWFVAAIVFGVFAASFIVGAVIASRTPDMIGVKFLASSSGRGGFVTTDRVGSMAFAAIISGLLCLGSVAAAIRAKRHEADMDKDINRDSEGP